MVTNTKNQANHNYDMIADMCATGKMVTIRAKITDTKLATALLGTMYPNNDKPNPFGVEVQEWALYDAFKANQFKIKQATTILQNPDLMDILQAEVERLILADEFAVNTLGH